MLILASTSPYKRALLERLGVEFQAEAPGTAERRPSGPEHPRDVAVRNAEAKALSVAEKHPGALVIGADQIGICGRTILSKPGSRLKAIQQLEALSGREHVLLTAVAVARREEDSYDVRSLVASNRIRMRQLTRAEIETYVDIDRPFDCAGAYKIESLGIALMESVGGEDPTAITGLPLIGVCRLLRLMGLDPLANRKGEVRK